MSTYAIDSITKEKRPVDTADNTYTKAETNELLNNKSNTGHTHDDLYYRASDVNNMLRMKSDYNHTHNGVYLPVANVKVINKVLTFTNQIASAVIPYPTGFNGGNCVCVAAEYQVVGTEYFTTNNAYYDNANALTNPQVSLGTSIVVTCMDKNASTGVQVSVRITLLKVA